MLLNVLTNTKYRAYTFGTLQNPLVFSVVGEIKYDNIPQNNQKDCYFGITIMCFYRGIFITPLGIGGYKMRNIKVIPVIIVCKSFYKFLLFRKTYQTAETDVPTVIVKWITK